MFKCFLQPAGRLVCESQLALKGINQGRNEEKANTEREKLRAETAEARVRELEAELAARNIHIE